MSGGARKNSHYYVLSYILDVLLLQKKMVHTACGGSEMGAKWRNEWTIAAFSVELIRGARPPRDAHRAYYTTHTQTQCPAAGDTIVTSLSLTCVVYKKGERLQRSSQRYAYYTSVITYLSSFCLTCRLWEKWRNYNGAISITSIAHPSLSLFLLTRIV